MRTIMFAALLTSFIAPAAAQTTEELLHAAQIHFQNARKASLQANQEIENALKAKQISEQRVLHAQQELAQANERLQAANLAKTHRDAELKKAIEQLDQIWISRQKSL